MSLSALVISALACQSVERFVKTEPAAEGNSAAGELSQSTPVPLAIQPNPQKFYSEEFMLFEKYVNIFGIQIFADEKVSDEILMHAAQVMAQYLDNNEDGYPDNQNVVNAMTRQSATLIMFEHPETRDEEEFLTQAQSLFESSVAIQALYANEVKPNSSINGEFDATLEEVLHLITASGYANAYPDVWGEEPGTDVANAMDAARGGRFMTAPASSPLEAWFSYDDLTCDYNCMVTEYIYWSLTSILGGQDFPGRFEQIRHEWRLNSPEKMKVGDPVMYALLTDPQYRFPSILPDGTYSPIR